MQEARKTFVLQWLLMRHPLLAFHPSLSAILPALQSFSEGGAANSPQPAMELAQ
jgi:hypothetical protein